MDRTTTSAYSMHIVLNMCACTHTCFHMYIYANVLMYICIYTLMCIHMHTCVHTCTHVCVHAHMCMYLHKCVYTYACSILAMVLPWQLCLYLSRQLLVSNCTFDWLQGHFVRSLGNVGDKDTENEVLLLEHDVPRSRFSRAVLDCLPSLPWSIPPEVEATVSSLILWHNERCLLCCMRCLVPFSCSVQTVHRHCTVFSVSGRVVLFSHW